MSLRFTRAELSGAVGDLGTLLPLTIALIQVNHLGATPVLLCIGLFAVLSGLYFRVTTPVQPMKLIAAYSIAQGLGPLEITTAGFLLGALLVLLAATSAIDLVARLIPKPVIRGVQLTTGVLLISKGVGFVMGASSLQTWRGLAEPSLAVQSVGPVPIGVILGVVTFVVVLLLLENERLPGGLVAVIGGALIGLALGGWTSLSQLEVGLNLPRVLPHGLPNASTVVLALTALALPQTPMTLGNAVLAQADLSRDLFGEDVGRRATPRAFTLSMGLANLATALLGGMPMCHGAGGLAAHYRFGARTAGANVMLGAAFIAVALILGDSATHLLSLLPLSVLGTLLVFAGANLALTIRDTTASPDLFVALLIIGVALATNLAIGAGVGVAVAYALKHPRLKI